MSSPAYLQKHLQIKTLHYNVGYSKYVAVSIGWSSHAFAFTKKLPKSAALLTNPQGKKATKSTTYFAKEMETGKKFGAGSDFSLKNC